MPRKPFDVAPTASIRKLLGSESCSARIVQDDLAAASTRSARHKKVLYFSSIDSKTRDTMDAARSVLSVSCNVVDRYDLRVTHVLVKVDESGPKLCKRTMSYLYGLLNGNTIVSHKWLLDSAAQGKWLDEQDNKYCVVGDTSLANEILESPILRARKSKENGLPRLLHGCFIVFQGKFGAVDKAPKVSELQDLAKFAGARVGDFDL